MPCPACHERDGRKKIDVYTRVICAEPGNCLPCLYLDNLFPRARHFGRYGIQDPQRTRLCPYRRHARFVLVNHRSNAVCLYLYAAFNETRYIQLRRLVGLPYMKGGKELPAEPPSSPEEVAALLKNTGVTGLVVVGYIIPAIVLWLMIFKPF